MLTPFRQDTNSLYITEKLNDLGVEVTFKTIVGDNREHLTYRRPGHEPFRRGFFMGGLGPTEDDLTREAVSDALALALRREPAVIADMEKRFAAYKFKMSANNLKQGDVITGATVLPNPNGTAPGQWITGKYEGSRGRSSSCYPAPRMN